MKSKRYDVLCGVCGMRVTATTKGTVPEHNPPGVPSWIKLSCTGGKVRGGPDVPASYESALEVLRLRATARRARVDDLKARLDEATEGLIYAESALTMLSARGRL